MWLYIFLAVTVIIAVLAFVLYFSLEQKVLIKNLKGKHAVVTGGSSGIGKVIAVELAKLGAHVTIISRDENKLKIAVNDIKAACVHSDQKIGYVVLDVTSHYDRIEEKLSELENTTGEIFMLVNCAGMSICGQFENMKVEDIKKMIDLNYFGTAYPTRYILPGMKKRNEGILVFVSSEAALIGIYGLSAYSAAKWAVRGLAESVFMELIGTNVSLTLAFPADTDTPGFETEQLTKPEETKLICGSAGLYSPDEVGKKIVKDALAGKAYSVYGPTGNMLTLLFCSTIESVQQVFIQIFTMGFLRLVTIPIILSFHKIVKDGLKQKKGNFKNQ